MQGKRRPVHARLQGLSLLGALVGVLAPGTATAVAAIAQDGKPVTLTVQPRQMATGTHNPPAGVYPMDTISTTSDLVIVPPQCVGATRCPLVILVENGGFQAQPAEFEWMRPVANKYGMIISIGGGTSDRSLQQLLQRFAIDPEKMAIIGHCGSVNTVFPLYFENPRIFSRVVFISGPMGDRMPDHVPNRAAEFLVLGGILEGGHSVRHAGFLRRQGNPVKTVLTIDGHEQSWEDYDFMGRWLEESWRIPDPAARPAPAVIADPLPLLTSEVLSQMTAFWTAFQQEPDSIRTTARRAHLREVIVPIPPGTGDTVSTWMTDMAALAAHYPSVAAALQRAELTAQQHDAYRIALLSALLKVNGAMTVEADRLEPSSVLAKNVAFAAAHRDELVVLEEAGIAPIGAAELAILLSGGSDFNEVEQVGAKGIWRMP